jgi:adenylate kinase
VERFGIPQISTGDLLRSAVVRGTAYGLLAGAAMDAGGLVADEIVLGILRERLADRDAAGGFILDGFPRNLVQAQALSSMLDAIGAPLNAVLLLEVDYGQIIKRISGRRTCQECGRVFNIHTAPPGSPPHCDRCDDQPTLVQRRDDQEATVRRRLEVYERETRPLAKHYETLGLLRTIDADAPVDEVTRRLVAVIESLPGDRVPEAVHGRG